jgi:RNA polymerase sigma-70 factor (ECF subfamily)
VPDITVSMPSDPDQGTEARRFRLIFDQQRRAVLAYVLRRVDDPEDAADAVAETFLVAWRRLDDVPRGDGARPWLLGVARRVLANQRRGARRHTGLADRLGRELATQIPVVEDASETDLLVRRALEALTDDDREILLLAGWEGLSPAEIAAAVGLSGVPRAAACTALAGPSAPSSPRSAGRRTRGAAAPRLSISRRSTPHDRHPRPGPARRRPDR